MDRSPTSFGNNELRFGVGDYLAIVGRCLVGRKGDMLK